MNGQNRCVIKSKGHIQEKYQIKSNKITVLEYAGCGEELQRVFAEVLPTVHCTIN
jgi:hypothetical protein